MRKQHIYLILLLIAVCIPFYCYGETSQPVAAFTFTKNAFQLNEPVEVIDTSSAGAGGRIVKSEWQIILKGKKHTASTIKSLLKNVPVGSYDVYLRVKDNNGVWSKWTSRKLQIIAAKPVTITDFTSGKSNYGIGEKLNLKYTYDNPNDLEITGQRWKYKNLTTDGSMISGKPKYFKKSGVYEVFLEVQDEWGNWSNKASCKVQVGNEVIERNGYYLFEKGTPGDLIEDYVDKDYNNFDPAEIVSMEDIPGTLIMSNSPETIYSSGILYQDTVSGKGRLILHHANGTSQSKKLIVRVTNPTDQTVELKITSNAIQGPGKHVLRLGQSAVVDYLKGTESKSYVLFPGKSVYVYSSQPYGSWEKGATVTGTMDFESTGSLTWQIAALDEQSAADNISRLSILPRDMHDRGTFNVLERHYTLNLTDTTELRKLVIGREKEEWMKGVDATTGEEIQNRGNYGMPVKITIQNNEDMGVIINARGGAYMGALKWNNQSVFRVPGEQVLKEHKVAALVGNIKAGETNEITYMLPNGSSAPVLFGFIPKSAWK